MSKKVEVTTISDLSNEIGAHSVALAHDGHAIEIDLTETEHKALSDFLAPYFEKGWKAGGAKRGPGRPKGAAKASASTPGATAGGSGLTKEQRGEVREYAKANGVALAERGRLPELAITAWQNQNPAILEPLKVRAA